MLHTTTHKICAQCGESKPATTEYFPPRLKGSVDGLRNNCRECKKIYEKAYHGANKSKHNERARLYYEANKDKVRESAREYRDRNRERISASKREYTRANRDKSRAAGKRHYKAHSAKKLEYQRKYRERNPDKTRQWARLNAQKRRTRKRDLPTLFTAQDWSACLAYFGGCCAACGAQSSLFDTVQADHLIPLSSPDCIGTVRENIVPLCKSCNSSKCDRDPAAWLEEKFGKRKAKQIMKRIQAYFDSLA